MAQKQKKLTKPGKCFTYRPSTDAQDSITTYRELEAQRTGSQPPSINTTIDTLCKLGIKADNLQNERNKIQDAFNALLTASEASITEIGKVVIERNNLREQLIEESADAANWRKLQRDLQAGVYVLSMPPEVQS